MESNRAYANRLEALLILIDLLNYIGIFVYLFAPIIRLVRMFFNTTLEIKKRQIFSMIICISILNMFFWGFTILGPFKQIYALNFPQILLSFPKSFEVNIVMSEVIPIIMLLIMQAMLVILLKFNGLDSVDFFREAKIKRNVKGLNSLNQNLRSVFHSFKNTLFTIQILAEQAQNNTELEASQNAIQRISTITADSMDSIIHLSDSFREIHLKTYKSSMVKVLEEAIERVKFPENIRLIREFREPKVESVVDSYYIIDVLTNILQNSCEAIKAAKQKEGIIKIELFTEHEWVVMKITDNGTGITKKEQEKIFNPFYTTKPGKDNWGIGLSYAFRIIKAHLGFITMSSKKDEYTTFQILLYRAEEQENG
jgi:signal transduction histidine kinase